MQIYLGRSTRRLLTCAVAVAVTILATSITDATALARSAGTPDSPDTASHWVAEVGPQFLENQDALDAFSKWIEDQPEYPASGYLGQNDTPESLSATLLWNGTDSLLAKVKSEGARRGITLSVQYRPYSRAAIDRISQALFAARDLLHANGFDLQMVRGLPADSAQVQAEGVVLPGFSLATITDVVRATAGAPIDVIAGAAVSTTSTPTRQNDSSPFNAGSFIWSRGGGAELCSTGFSYFYQGRAHVSTARHCNPPSGNFWSYDGGSSATYNREGGVVATTSTGAMNLLAGTGSYFAYDGAWNNSAGYSKAVYDVEKVSNGDRVCTGGGNSGEHCSIEIESQMVTFDDDYGTVSTVEGYQVSGDTAVASGDSGGPVIVPIGSGKAAGDVHAVGIIQGSYDLTHQSCPSSLAYNASNVGCAPTVLFTYVATALGGTPSITLNTN